MGNLSQVTSGGVGIPGTRRQVCQGQGVYRSGGVYQRYITGRRVYQGVGIPRAGVGIPGGTDI